MECREPLYITVPANTLNKAQNTGVRSLAPPPSIYSRSTGRQSPSLQYPSTPPQQAPPPATIQIPIPIPKNVVLISMMEASERHAQDVESSSSRSDGSMDNDDEEYDLNQIISGMATFAGSCGTYAVRDSLAIIPNHPNKKIQLDESDKLPDNREIASVREPIPLEKGQTIQVVEFEDGVAKLARDSGFIVANSSQLVKIGGPLDNVCRLEGLLDTVSRRGHDLQKELEENKKVEADLSKQIEFGRSMEPSHPIVTENRTLPTTASFDPSDSECLTPVSGTQNQHTDKTSHFCTTPEQTRSTEFFMDASPDDGHTSHHDHPSLPQANSIDNADINTIPRLPSYRLMPDENLDVVYGCGALLGNAYIFTRDGHSTRNPIEAASLEDPLEDGHESSRRSNGSRSPNPGLSSSFSSSFDTIDFRTGMSGHRALNTTHFKNGHSPNQRGGSRLMMSQHAGIGQVRRPMHRTNNNLGTL